ncbi:MAG: sigma-70 family RNA polymerase sigma factor [Hyphomonadaceae bacterium]|nr:sigma-70 family RNA polymerase sigma factor [Hyphomonadaceae bacterium]
MASDETRLKELLLKGLAGDAAAHRAFLTEAASALRGYFRNRLRSSPEDAEDLVQETIIALHTKAHTYDPAYPLTAWLYAIARYRLIDHLRRTRRRGIAIPIDDAPEAVLTEPEQESSDARHDVAALLALLPEKQRRAIELIKLEQKSVREAAALTGWSESDVKVSAHRGVKALAKLMGREAVA